MEEEAKPIRQIRASTKANMDELIKLVAQGSTIADACRTIGVTEKTYEYYKATYDDFADEMDMVRKQYKRGTGQMPRTELPDFPTFSEKYLGQRLFKHHLQLLDMLEGREPRDLHPNSIFVKGDPGNSIVNMPPGHAKSTFMVNYATYRIIENPNIKIIFVSKKQEMAQDFLLQIKERLTSPQYAELQKDFAPPGGFKEGSVSWKANRFYIGGRDSEAKDPTAQALGIRGAMYGARADLIILDDPIDNNNVNEYDKQISWLNTIVSSRLSREYGKVIVVGTRIAAKDLYSELRDPSRYYDDEQPWSYLLQPAVLEYADDPKDWVTLWPEADAPAFPNQQQLENGMFGRWDGPTLYKVRKKMSPTEWSRIYMQEQVAEDNIFKEDIIRNACQPRISGLIPDNERLGREGGMDGLRIIAGLDPAAVGHTAMVVLGLDIKNGMRYVIDVHNESGMHPDAMRSKIKDFTERYGVQEWRVEGNAFQRFLTLDSELNQYMATRGVMFTEHTTGNNKHDPDFGVMAMNGLFENNLIKLPNSSTENIKALITQLAVWQPNPPKSTKTDIVMALWFAELRAQELVVKRDRSKIFRTNNQFTTARNISERRIISTDGMGELQALPVRSNWR